MALQTYCSATWSAELPALVKARPWSSAHTAMHSKCKRLVILFSVLCAATARTLAFNPPVHELRPIPHILHQTWTDTSAPEAQTRRLNSWRAAHPNWEYKWGLSLPLRLSAHLLSTGPRR